MWIRFVIALVLMTSSTTWAQCKPGDNCKLPNCRCWDDPNSPGNLDAADIPQMILVSFEYAINIGNVDLYRELFDGITNPNNCQAKGTFFVQQLNTDFNIVKELYDEKHEIGVTSASGTIPETEQQWKETYAAVRAEIGGAGVPVDDIIGSRGPELYTGGNDQFESLEQNQLEYDSTCVSLEYVSKDNLLWPYTYDFIAETPKCTIGITPTKAFPGKWQFLVANLEWKGQKCASPSACSPFLQDSQDAFDLLYNAFAKHYQGKTRSPFILYVDALWLTVEAQNQGTKQFLEFVRSAFDDTWIVTSGQALAWIKDPTPAANVTTFAPWEC